MRLLFLEGSCDPWGASGALESRVVLWRLSFRSENASDRPPSEQTFADPLEEALKDPLKEALKDPLKEAFKDP